MTSGGLTDVRGPDGWLPKCQDQLESWIRGWAEFGLRREPLHPVVEAFRCLIDGDPVLRMHAHQMIEQVPSGGDYERRRLESVEQMLELIDALLHVAPEFSSDLMVIVPFVGILDWTIATPAGFAFYRDRRVNDALRDILKAWSAFLSGPDSRSVLTDGESGWLSPEAREAVYLDEYRYDADDEHGGFASWNDFFTRRFRDGRRPVAGADDSAVIVSPCEATPYRIASGVQRRDDFWAKSELYSLDDLLAGDETVEGFVGGTVFQAFLSPLNYHRWHAPVAGTVVRAVVVPGTYFSAADCHGADASDITISQGYLAHVATRAILLIDADDPAIGLVAVVFIGMFDVSSCVFAEPIVAGARVDKGDEVGFFQYGGSTFCIVFEPGVVEDFAIEAIPKVARETPTLLLVRSRLATARAKKTALEAG